MLKILPGKRLQFVLSGGIIGLGIGLLITSFHDFNATSAN